MLHLLLTATDGGTAWRHLLAEGEARTGWECAGPLGLAKRVGRILGMPTEIATAPDRLAAFGQRLDALDDGLRSYSESRRNDPFGVAAYLLDLRDRLRLAGWRGQPIQGSRRLEDLSAIEHLDSSAIPPGFADLLEELRLEVARLDRFLIPLFIKLAGPREGFAPLVRLLLDALRRSGARIEESPPDAALAPDSTDLGRLQRSLIDGGSPPASLGGDGTVLLLEADTPVEAAELTTSLARRRPLSSTTFVVAAESAPLDTALSRQGLPTLGLSSSSALRPHLQVLPLRLTLAFRPRDPFRAAELLLLPGGPLPGRVRATLLAALGQMPGIGSPAWNEAVEELVADTSPDARAGGHARGQDLRSRIDSWFGGESWDAVEGIPASKAADLCEMVARWAGSRTGAAEEASVEGPADDAPLWAHAAAVARTLQRMLIARPPDDRLSELALAQLHDLAVGGGTDLAAFEGEAGRPAICRAPGAVLPGASDVIWWGFVQDTDAGPLPQPWTSAERAALIAAGLSLPEPGEERRLESRSWRRPILSASERVVLVRWRLQGSAPLASHAFADELRTRLAAGALDRCTVTSEGVLTRRSRLWEALLEQVKPSDPVIPRGIWRAPAELLVPAGTLSATSLESFLGCPFKWALEYQGQLRPGRGMDLAEGSQLLGDFAHRLLEDMLLGPDRIEIREATEAVAKAWAETAFDARVGTEAAPLVRRGLEVELDRARSLVGGAASTLVHHLRAGGWDVKAAEHPVSGTFAGYPIAGYVDLLLEKAGKEALLDLKLSGSRYRREELEEGRALQLALYASMLRPKGRALPPSGFLILDEGQLFTVDRGAFPGATVIDGPSAQETLKGAEEGFAYWKKVLSKGLLPIPAEHLDWQEDVVEAAGDLPDEESLARREPGCRFCNFEAICKVGIGMEDSP